jgi:signal transduction histidine kinase
VAVFEHATDSVLVYSTKGELLRANPRARGKLEELAGGVPPTIEGLREHLRVGPAGSAPLADGDVSAFLRGEVRQGQLRIGRTDERLVHLRAGPIRDGKGRVRALVVIARDVTDLRALRLQAARVEAAVATARRAGHELASPLGAILLHAQMLLAYDEPVGLVAQSIVASVESASASLRRLQRITRFVEADLGMGLAMLDLDAAVVDESAPS